LVKIQQKYQTIYRLSKSILVFDISFQKITRLSDIHALMQKSTLKIVRKFSLTIWVFMGIIGGIMVGLLIGNPIVPMAGLVMMTIVIRAVGLPLEGSGLILAVDRLLDMLRTATNVWSDSICALIIAKSEGELDSIQIN